MSIEIRNFDGSKKNKSFLGNFEAVSLTTGMVIAFCEAFIKEGEVYARLPSKVNKLPDGTFGPKQRLIYFKDETKTLQLQKEISKALQQFFSQQGLEKKEDDLPF